MPEDCAQKRLANVLKKLWTAALAALFRAEFFDFLNHPNFAPPVDNLEPIDANGQPVQGFGVIDSTLPNANREIQFGLKVIF